MRLEQIVALGSALVLATPALAQDLDLDAGTMQLGGITTFTFESDSFDGADSVSGIALRVAPEFGYFVIDNLALVARFSLGIFSGDLYDDSPTLLGFGVGGRYFLPLGPVAGYGGLEVGMGFAIPESGDTAKAFEIDVPLGLLIPLNSQVAIDGGLRIIYRRSLDDCPTGAVCNTGELVIPVGYFGVQAFF